MNDKSNGEAAEGESTLSPAGSVDAGGQEDVLAENDRISGSPTKKKDVAGVETGGKEAWPSINVLEIILFTTIPGEAGAEFHVYSRAGGGYEHASKPYEKGEANAAGEG